MLQINYGDHGPRVVLLQILLNRRGNALIADGIFGPKTRHAVVSFQRTVPSLSPSGTVDPVTFNALFRDSGLSVLDVVDVGDPLLQQREANEFRQAGSHPIEIGLMCNGVGQMVSDVIRRCARVPVALLRITGHGNLGRWMTVSVGDVVDLSRSDYRVVASEDHSYISERNFTMLAATLSQLKPVFARFGSMEHLGCSIGGNPSGRRMMQRLASLLNVPVSAGIQTQRSTLRFDGAAHTAYPSSGSLASWSRQFRNVSL
ncbi:MAG: peptidoglycan-binding domain-containing protein [Alphaproteobacteria bacterium]